MTKRAKLAKMSGRSSDNVARLLQDSIDYLCLPRVDPYRCSPGDTLADDQRAPYPGTIWSAPSPASTDNAGVPLVVRPIKGAALTSAPDQAESAFRPRTKKLQSQQPALLPWNGESLTSLLLTHQAMAAAFLSSERLLHTTIEGNQDADRRGGGQQKSARSAELFDRAIKSLTVSLAAAEGFCTTSSSSPSAELSATLPSTTGMEHTNRPDQCSTVSPTFAEGGDRRVSSKGDTSTKSSTPPSSILSTATVAIEGEDGNTQTRSASTPAPAAGNSEVFVVKRAQTLNSSFRPRDDTVVAAASTAADAGIWTADVEPKVIAEILAMRSTAREGLGFLNLALDDVRRAIVTVPRAPKLWEKAACLALRVATDTGLEDNSEDGLKARSLSTAAEVERKVRGLRFFKQ